MSALPDPAAMRLAGCPIERRERRLVTMPGFAALADGSTTEILVVDLSYEGCGIETPVELQCGQHITLSVLRRGAIQADVRWYRKGKAGLVFRADKPAEAHRRERIDERVCLYAEARMRRLGKANYRVRMFDLSPRGCKVEWVERPRVGEYVVVKLAALDALQAEVCWVEDLCVGLRFTQPIHSAVFDLLVQRLRQPS